MKSYTVETPDGRSLTIESESPMSDAEIVEAIESYQGESIEDTSIVGDSPPKTLEDLGVPNPDRVEAPSTRGRVKEIHALSDEENARLENAFSAGVKNTEKGVGSAERVWLNARYSWYSNTTAGYGAKKIETGGDLHTEIARLKAENEKSSAVLELRNSQDPGASQILAHAYGGYSSVPNEEIESRLLNNYNQIQELETQTRPALMAGLEAQAYRAGEYEGMPDWKGKQGILSLTGQLAGSSATFETFAGGGAGTTPLRTIGREALAQGAINLAANPFLQAGNIESGDQPGYEWLQAFADVGMGTGAPVALKLPKGLTNQFMGFLAKRGWNKQQISVLRDHLDTIPLADEVGPVKEAAKKVKAGGSAVMSAAKKVLIPIASRLEDMAEGLGSALRNHAFVTGRLQSQGHQQVQPFLKWQKKLPTYIQRHLDTALKNRDVYTIGKIVKTYGGEKQYQAVKNILNDFHTKIEEAGYDVYFKMDYWPRRIKDFKGLMNALKKKDPEGVIDRAARKLSEAQKLGEWDLLDPQIKADLYSRVMLDHSSGIVQGATGNLKKRTIKELTADLEQYYHDSPTALLQYVDSVSRLIADAHFFGKNTDNLPVDIALNPVHAERYQLDSFGKKYEEIVREKGLTFDQQEDLKDIMSAYFGYNKALIPKLGTATKWYKSLIHITTIGNYMSALTQFGDIVPTLWKNGAFNSALGFKEAVKLKRFGKFTREDVGVENIAEEFSDHSFLAKWAQRFFKWSGFATIDRLGKEGFINARYIKLRKQAQAALKARDIVDVNNKKISGRRTKQLSNKYEKLRKELEPAFGDKVDQVIKDLAEGTGKYGPKTELVRFALFDSLSQFQPITRAEMPEAYLQMPNGKIIYTLKTFQIRQMDSIRREAYKEIKKGNVIKGMRNLVQYSSYWIAMGMGVDSMKDWILGRDVEPTDLAINNMIKMLGFTKWNINQVKDQPVMGAVNIFVPPHQVFDDIYKDFKSNMTDEDFQLKYAETIRDLPLLGKMFHSRLGAGYLREEKRKWEKAMRPPEN